MVVLTLLTLTAAVATGVIYGTYHLVNCVAGMMYLLRFLLFFESHLLTIATIVPLLLPLLPLLPMLP